MAGPRDTMYGRSNIQILDDATVVARAQDVAIQRGQMVAETLFHIAAIRSLPGVPAAATIACEAAKLQDTKAQFGQQAAHLLPGAIAVNGTYVWDLAQPQRLPGPLAADVVRLQAQTMWCFAKTTVLPAYVNRADSEAERSTEEHGAGLKELFGMVVQEFWSSARVQPDAPFVVDRTAIMKALGRWFTRVNLVYTHAARRKVDKARGAIGGTQGVVHKARMREARVLKTYADTFVVQTPERFVAAHAREISQRYRWL
jgi:hypothetical protein